MTGDRPAQRRGLAPVLIVVPSLVSGVGVAFMLVAILVNNQIVQDTFLVMGVLLLWSDFFITMAIFRYSIRSIDRRLRVLEQEAVAQRRSPRN
ncbi:MAG: hypothetical protein ACE5EF_04125 [Dehalococcoidia bacterium]